MKNYKSMFKFDQPQPECKLGGMLIAQPFLQEAYFQRACICIVENGSSTTGIVLNKITNLVLNDLIDEINIDERIPVFCGGPLSMDRLFFLHDNPHIPKSMAVIDGLYFNGDFDAIIEYINSGQPISGHVKFFIGYSGWDKYQLSVELVNHVWAVNNNVDTSFFLQTSIDNYWSDSVKALGDSYRSWLLCPLYPSLN